jgi:hypothetical protein
MKLETSFHSVGSDNTERWFFMEEGLNHIENAHDND